MSGGPAVVSGLPGGGVMVLRGGLVGLGWSRGEAEDDWRRALRAIAGGPEHPTAETGGDPAAHAPLVTPTEEAPTPAARRPKEAAGEPAGTRPGSDGPE